MIEVLRFTIHYALHLVVPFFIAYFFFNKNWKYTYLLLLATMLIDLDHLLVTPIFDAQRCSIGFHPLHTYYALAIYIIFLAFKKSRIIGLGFCLHFLADTLDCLWL